MSDIEEEFLLATERGETDTLKQFLRTKDYTKLNINCRDPLDRSALIIAIDNRNLDIIRLLLETDIRVCDALLYAIQEEFVEGLELLLDHSSALAADAQCHRTGESHFFSGDITPLMLAAQRNNLEIIKLLLTRNVSPIPNPHDPRCGCDACGRARNNDCLKHSRSRINAYKALASPMLMALSSSDPLATAFRMSAKLEDLAQMEPEYKEDYMRLRAQCQSFATKLLDYARTSNELETLLNFDGPTRQARQSDDSSEFGDDTQEVLENAVSVPLSFRDPARRGAATSRLARLKLAIRCKQKTFCAHPNIQELLATMWYENLPGFRRKNIVSQTLQVVCIGLMFPVYSSAYLLAPHTQFGGYIKKPFIKFVCHSASYITFIIVLLLASQRMEAFYSWSSVLSLFTSEQSAPAQQLEQPVRLALHQLQQAGSGHLVEDNLTLWKQTINSPPPPPATTSGFSDDVQINTLAAIYRHTMGQAATSGDTGSTARGLDSLSKIFEELPASSKKRGALPSPIESIILIWVLSLIWAELKQIRALGMNYYREDMWNILDSVASGCYIGTIILRVVSYVQSDDRSLEVAREHWHAYDPTLLSEGLFATATIFSALKLVYIFSVNPYLGPLQISLGRMIIDIVRFSWIYMLVLFAFACGMNQLLWYYADLERHQCLNVTNYNLAQYYKAKSELPAPASAARSPAEAPNAHPFVRALATGPGADGAASASGAPLLNATAPFGNASSLGAATLPPTLPNGLIANMTDESLMESAFSASLEDDSSMPPVTIDDSCKTWRHFANVFESCQTLFWANFGLVDLENFDLTGIRQYTRFWALLMFGCYCFINVIVVLNLLIAMMNHSYVKISKRSDIEWKFARTRLWVSYFEDGSTVPAPFNIVPSFKSARYLAASLLHYLWRPRAAAKADGERSIKMAPQQAIGAAANSRTAPATCAEPNYDTVIRALVRRYLVSEQRQLEKRSGLTEAKLRRWSRLRLFE